MSGEMTKARCKWYNVLYVIRKNAMAGNTDVRREKAPREDYGNISGREKTEPGNYTERLRQCGAVYSEIGGNGWKDVRILNRW